MADDETTDRQYYEDFRTRLRGARESMGLSQPKMALALSMTVDNYKKYETRGGFPMHALERLSILTRRSIEYWVTGRNVRQLQRKAAG
jgi:transcriptional regulator with XRE-family HTH domain